MNLPQIRDLPYTLMGHVRDTHLKSTTLDQINAIRTEWGYAPLDELPKGGAKRAKGCVIARGLRDIAPTSVGSSITLFKDDNTHSYLLSEDVKEFIARFDAKKYPELITNDSHFLPKKKLKVYDGAM